LNLLNQYQRDIGGLDIFSPGEFQQPLSTIFYNKENYTILDNKENYCPTMVCNFINQFINDKQIDIKGLKQSTYCNIDKTGDTPSPSPTQNPIQDIFSTFNKLSTKYKVGIIISILLTLIFIFLAF